ncbi:MAG: DnaA regulatory inactivator Hda [Congregibacter sp.]
MRLASPQLPLEIGLSDTATLENFFRRESLGALLSAIDRLDPQELSYLHGGAAVGKSHLLQALCHRQEQAVYLPLASLADLPPEQLLDGLEQSSLLALDDAQQVAGNREWEEALFHLVNRARTAGCQLWVAASLPPYESGFQLPDLCSRLAGGVTWAMPPCDDEEKQAILSFRAQRRGLELSPVVARYLCSRESRALDDLLAVLDRLDQASMQLQRPLSVPLVKQVMGW